ncbi:MAG: flagellar basal-body rod protein FlgF [Methylomonas sp.]|nr:flagellar basal-body rod protein FlgF [Methylomonas sp.]PPD19979.1 MAG: flagellar basal-body rod protein FlgF [Methylomonas sp.]PPD26519.1 MAG: flagellar basal-body rod protein FlgF [Methylomonas sp.]PPD36943.1 MAG: flagellar basal-body rod protein FlgF [Methylomonas sp.]PPD38286.1 MAG: flagellar basal-body rod protein FlgF [Methylomonas sp.]
MDRSLYIAMNGAKQTLLAQTANANNLANSQTSGFKQDFEQFRAMPAFGPGYPSRVYSMTERPGSDVSNGAVQTTGRDLDIAINGPGWFAVQGENGAEAYTRAGDLRILPQGQLQNGAGQQLLDDNGQPIAIPPARKIDIGQDGTISIIPQGAIATNAVLVGRIKMVNPGDDKLEKRGDGLMYLKQSGGPPVLADARIGLVQGALESSNVNALSAMVEMIELARNFELQSKVMRTADDNAGRSARLMQMA